MSENNYHNFFPIIVPTYLIPSIKYQSKDNDGNIVMKTMDKVPRPYTCLFLKHGGLLTEWMWNPLDGMMQRIPLDNFREPYLNQGKVARFLLQGTKTQYILLENGTFILPFSKQPIQIEVNGNIYTFDNVYPHLEYFLNGKMEDTGHQEIVNMGFGWRRNITLFGDKEVKLIVAMIVELAETGGSWHIQAQNPEDRKDTYNFDLNYDGKESILRITVHDKEEKV